MTPKLHLATPLLYALLTVVAVITLIPFVWVMFGAFKSQAEIMSAPGAWLPRNFGNFDNFIELFEHRQFGTFMRNSFIVSVFTVVANVLFSSMAGYALAKLPFKGRKKFSGELQALGEGWRLVLDAPRPTRGVKRAAAAPNAPETDQALDFSLDEVREAHLVPVVDFKGRRFAAPEAATGAGLPDERNDGGRIQ